MHGAARKIGLAVPHGDLATRRDAFADAELALGGDEIRRRLRRDIRLTDSAARITSRLSRGRRVVSACDLHVEGGGAADFVAWSSTPTGMAMPGA